MSAGVFVRSKYAANYGAGSAVHPIRCQPETLLAITNAITNTEPAGAQNNPISAKISNSKRSLGLSPRYITIQFPLTGQPAGYKAGGITRIPCLTLAFFNAAAVGGTVTYQGVACICVSKSPEQAD